MNDLLDNVYLPDLKKKSIRESDAYKLLKDNNKDTSVLEGYDNTENIEPIEFPVFNTQGDKDKFIEENATSTASTAKDYLETFGNFLTDETEDLVTSLQLAAVNGADVAVNLMPLAYKMFETAPIAMAMPKEFFNTETEEDVMRVAKHYSDNLGEYRKHLFEKQKDNGWVKDILSLVVQDSAYSIPAFNMMRKAGVPKYPAFFLSAAFGAIGVENVDRDGDKTYFAPFQKDVQELKKLLNILPDTPADKIADEVHQALEYGSFGTAIPGIIDAFVFMKKYLPKFSTVTGSTAAVVGMTADNEAEGSPFKAIVNAVTKAPVFKSSVIDAASKIPNVASGDQIFSTIKNTSGVKANELKWMDLEGFLKGKNKVTKEEVLTYIEANRIDVTEVMFPKAGKDFGMYDDMLKSSEARQIAFANSRKDLRGGDQRIDFDNIYVSTADKSGGKTTNERLTYYEFDNSPTGKTIKSFDDPNTFDVDIDAIKSQYKSDNNSVDFYIVEDITTSGRTIAISKADFEDPNFNTIIKTVTKGEPVGPKYELQFINNISHDELEKFALEYQSRTLRGLRSKQTGKTQYERYTEPGGQDYKELILKYKQSGVLQGTQKPIPVETNVTKYDDLDSFDVQESPHFREPNELAHVRFKTRTLDNGKKVLAVEEMQSDLVQGVKKNNQDIMEDATPNAYTDEVEQMDAMDNIIKDFPFKNNWYELAIKRLTRYAADNGFDAISVPKGSVVQDRYNLVRKFDSIEIGSFDLARREIGIEAQDQNGVLQISELMKFDNLEKRFGKDTAERIINKGKTLKQADYDNGNNSVTFNQPIIEGGEGKNSLYDKAIPAYLKKYGKKWNAKIYDDVIDTTVRADDPAVMGLTKDLKRDMPVTIIEITPEMKQSVQTTSQPLFELFGGVSLATWGAKAVSDSMKNNTISQTTN
jgi:hypothetical protein